MTSDEQEHQGSLPTGMKIAEFITIMAGLMALQALSIDTMLPALPDIGRDLAIPTANDRQAIILFFFVGIGTGALVFGPLSDRFGRRPVLILSVTMMLVATIMCALAPSFPVLLGARLVAGFFGASCRVVTISIVRDCFRGDPMARIMSLILIVFIIVPAIAPSLGQVVLLVAPWRAIFALLAVLVAIMAIWAALRLPETLHPENRTAAGARELGRTFWTVVTNRGSIGHMVASGLMFSGLVGFIVSIQQVFFDVFHRPDVFPLAFALMALGMGAGSLFNSRLVERFGARRLSQSAVIALILVSAVRCVLILLDREGMVMFVLLQSLTMTCFSFAGANLSAISLEPFSRGAGFASSIQAALTTIMSVVLGGFVGSSFDGTLMPLSLGFLTFGAGALLVIAWAERWRLFRRPNLAHLRQGVGTPPTP
ncbi:MAG: multidrug effflux MFS transporter [Sphingobium sp.]